MDRDNPDEMIEFYVAVKTAAAAYAAFIAASPPGKASEIDALASAYVDSIDAGKTVNRLSDKFSNLSEAELRVIEQVRRESSGPDSTVEQS